MTDVSQARKEAPIIAKKAAKKSCYQKFFNAFSFEEKGPKEKALQKEKRRFFAQAAGLPLLKKRSKTIEKKRVRTVL